MKILLSNLFLHPLTKFLQRFQQLELPLILPVRPAEQIGRQDWVQEQQATYFVKYKEYYRIHLYLVLYKCWTRKIEEFPWKLYLWSQTVCPKVQCWTRLQQTNTKNQRQSPLPSLCWQRLDGFCLSISIDKKIKEQVMVISYAYQSKKCNSDRSSCKNPHPLHKRFH